MAPLFNDSTAYVETLAKRELAFRADGTNGADGWDILGLVVERVSTSTSRRGRSSDCSGRTGAGKTTLARVLATLLAPDAGRAEVVGRDVVHEAAAVRELLGLIAGTGGNRAYARSWTRTAPWSPTTTDGAVWQAGGQRAAVGRGLVECGRAGPRSSDGWVTVRAGHDQPGACPVCRAWSLG